jgi:large subunit ribosomal protein L17
MHRHGYQGRKLHRETDQREALIKGLADALIIYGKIETTLPKAKELRPYVEKLITKAKKNDLHNRRQIIKSLNTLTAANKLVDEIGPILKNRNSGYLRIKKSVNRRGDNSEMAYIEFVDSINSQPTEIETPKETLDQESK